MDIEGEINDNNNGFSPIIIIINVTMYCTVSHKWILLLKEKIKLKFSLWQCYVYTCTIQK